MIRRIRRDRLVLCSLLAGALVGSVASCPLVTAILQREGAARNSFEAGLLEVSNILQGMFFDSGYDRPAAITNSARALELWMDLYTRFYLSPPAHFRDQAEWRPLMDSVTAPLMRLRKFAREGDYLAGHRQLTLLQDSLTEFYGEPPERVKMLRLNPLTHTVLTLGLVEAGTPAGARELAARARLLRSRYDAWRKQLPQRLGGLPTVLRFEAALLAFETARTKGRTTEVEARRTELASMIEPLVQETSMAAWGIPVSPPSPPAGEAHPEKEAQQ